MLTVVAGLYFANGITPTADGSALVFAETQGATAVEVLAHGREAGTVTPLAVNLPGMPDNISTGADGRIWCAMVTPANAAAEWLCRRAPLDAQAAVATARTAAAEDQADGVGGRRSTRIPATQSPAYAPSTLSSAMVTGLVEADGKLWMGCIGSPAVASRLAATASH